MPEPADALRDLAAVLRAEDSVISPYVSEPDLGAPCLGVLAAAGSRAARAPAEYALVVESVREGYLLHYGAARLVRDADPDLALLAGDYLYALGLERLAALGDLDAVRELSDLISLAAQVHDGGRPAGRAQTEAGALWLACATAIGTGPSASHAEAKSALRAASEDAATALWGAAIDGAAATGLEGALRDAADAIDFFPHTLS